MMAETEQEFVTAVNELKDEPFSDSEKRKKILYEILDDAKNAQKIADLLT
jgi:hypothetical protein